MLTPRQEKFAQLYVELGNASEAYRQAYNSTAKAESVNRMAKELIDNIKVSSMISEINQELAEKHNITLNSLLSELEEARNIALNAETPQSSAAVAATMGKAKLVGMDKQIIDHRSTDGSMSPKSIDPALVSALVNKLTD
jgi:phage terminase small subunit